MNERTTDPNPLAPTRLAIGARREEPAPVRAVKPAHCAVARFAGSTDGLSVETVNLLRQRLRIAALIALAPLFFFMILSLFNGADQPEWIGWFGWILQVLTIATVTGVSLLLWSKRPLAGCALRKLELMLFGSVGLFFAWLQFVVLWCPHFLDFAKPDASSMRVISELVMSMAGIRWFFLIVLYGVFIPNTWKRCATVVALAVLAPLLISLIGGLAQPLLRPHLLTSVLILTIMLGAAAAIAIFGSMRIHILEQQASQARRLGQYQLQNKLGSGGMGEVYQAEHTLLRRPCAIKIINPNYAQDTTQLTRFEREVQAMAKLTHWNSVEVFDYGRTDDGTFYYVMEFLPGPDLERLVKQHGPLPPARVVHLMRQVCHALREAHGLGLLHRDIKPSNVIACYRGGLHDVVKLLDFGLVHCLGELPSESKLTIQGTILGSPQYLSPEQARGRTDLDGRSDIYSVGGLAYYLLTGRPPFVRETVMELLIAHASDAIVAPSHLRADVPRDLEAIILRCLEKQPDNRFPDVESLDQALAECEVVGKWTETQAAEWWRHNGETVPLPTAGTPNPQAETVSISAMPA